MSDTGEKNFDPRHRVVGAVILIGLAVILLPMILAGRNETTRPEAQLPADKTKRVVVELTQPAPGPTAAPAPSPPAASAAPAPAPASATAPVSTTPAASPASPPAAAPAPVAAAQHWFVQAGIFASAANARSLADRLKKHGYRVQLDKVALAKGTGTRVRIGPYSESAAKDAQARLQAQLKIKGLIKSDQAQ